MNLLAGEDGQDFTSPPVPLLEAKHQCKHRIAFFTNNGFARCVPEVEAAVRQCAEFLEKSGMQVEEQRPPGAAQAYELELAILGADGAEGIDRYLEQIGSTQVHPLLTAFLKHMRPFRMTASEFAARWAQWDNYRAAMARFFAEYDAVLCPVYTQPALRHGHSADNANFEGFSYTMAWNLAGAPAATVRCAEAGGLPVNVQVAAAPWRDLLAIDICHDIEQQFGGWKPSSLL